MKSFGTTSDTELDERLDYLIKQMEYLCVQQTQTTKELQAIQRERSRRRVVEIKVTNDDSSTERGDYRDWMTDDEDYERISSIPDPNLVDKPLKEYSKKYPPRIGDRVTILNPSVGQEHEGMIEGFCRDGKPKIRTSEDHPIVIRTHTNLKCIKRGEGHKWHNNKTPKR